MGKQCREISVTMAKKIGFCPMDCVIGNMDIGKICHQGM